MKTFTNDFTRNLRPLRPLPFDPAQGGEFIESTPLREYSEFRLRLFADRRTSFPQRSLEKSMRCLSASRYPFDQHSSGLSHLQSKLSSQQHHQRDNESNQKPQGRRAL